MKRKSSRVRFLLFLLVMSLSGGLLAVNLRLGRSRAFLHGKTEVVRIEDLNLSIDSPGVVEPDTLVSVKTEAGGTVANKSVKEGDPVQKGQALLQFSVVEAQAELERKQAQVAQAGRELEKARNNYKVTSELWKQRAIPKKELYDAKQALDKAQEAVQMAVKDYEAQQRKASQASVLSPIDGVVLVDKIGMGGYVGAGQEMFVIAQVDKFHVRAKVDEMDISKITAGQQAEIRLEAFPRVVFPGEVTKIGLEAQQGAFAEVDVNVEIKDLKGTPVKPNLSAKVSFAAGRVSGALTVPLVCIEYEGEDNYLHVLSSEGVLARRKVELGPSSHGRVVVLDGLGAGETVLLSQGEGPSAL